MNVDEALTTLSERFPEFEWNDGNAGSEGLSERIAVYGIWQKTLDEDFPKVIVSLKLGEQKDSSGVAWLGFLEVYTSISFSEKPILYEPRFQESGEAMLPVAERLWTKAQNALREEVPRQINMHVSRLQAAEELSTEMSEEMGRSETHEEWVDRQALILELNETFPCFVWRETRQPAPYGDWKRITAFREDQENEVRVTTVLDLERKSQTHWTCHLHILVPLGDEEISRSKIQTGTNPVELVSRTLSEAVVETTESIPLRLRHLEGKIAAASDLLDRLTDQLTEVTVSQ